MAWRLTLFDLLELVLSPTLTPISRCTRNAFSMLYPAQDIHALILHITWLCITGSAWINPRFSALFPTYEHLAALLSGLGLQYRDDLFDTVQSATAPSISWFKSANGDLPQSKLWGIYVITLRKGQHYKLYIGSGTGTARTGVRNRIQQHWDRKMEPRYLRQAKDDGYKQIHVGMLATCKVPTPGLVPTYRACMVAVEAALHYVFWPMHMQTQDMDYGFPDSKWPRADFEYGGACGHNPLVEGPNTDIDDLGLTAEQLEAIAAAALARRQEIKRVWDRKNRDENRAEYNASHRKWARAYQPKASAKVEAVRASKTHYCSPCERAFGSSTQLRKHEATDRHKAVVADGCGLYCEPCDYQAKDRNVLRRHRSSALHHRRCAAAANN